MRPLGESDFEPVHLTQADGHQAVMLEKPL